MRLIHPSRCGRVLVHESGETIESKDVILQEFLRDSHLQAHGDPAQRVSRQSAYEKRRFKALLSARRGKQSFARLVSERVGLSLFGGTATAVQRPLLAFEPLTQWVLESPPADEAAGERKECFVDVVGGGAGDGG